MVKSEKIVPLPVALLIIVVGGVTCVATAKWIVGSASRKNSIERSVDDTSSHSSRIVSGESDLFYAPTRNPPYKASEVAHYRTRESAIKALAGQFDRTPSWVEANIGSTNDLNQIHNNLSRALLTQTSGRLQSATSFSADSTYSNTHVDLHDWEETRRWLYKELAKYYKSFESKNTFLIAQAKSDLLSSIQKHAVGKTVKWPFEVDHVSSDKVTISLP